MITDLVNQRLHTASDRTFIREQDGRDFALSELRTDVDRIAAGLQAGFGDCDRLIIGIAMRSSYAWVAAMFAIMKVRAVLLPIPIEFSDEQIHSLMGKARGVFVGNDAIRTRLSSILPEMPCLTIDSPYAPGVADDTAERVEPGILAIIHTSGTTARPKGVKIQDEAVAVLVSHLLKRLPLRPLNYFSIVPMSLLIEQVLGIFLPLVTGGTLTLMPAGMVEYGARSGNALFYLHAIARAHPDFLYLPPKILEEASALLQQQEVTTLFGKGQPHIITGGARVSPNVLRNLDAEGVAVFEAYGLSENSSVVSLNSPGMRRIGSVGTLLDGITPKIVDGELLVSSPTLCAGYYNADDTACDIIDGYLHTGDIAEFREGFLYITGRKKHVIILSTARNLSPEWVESIYRESPLIDDIIVVGEGREAPGAVVLSTAPEDAIIDDMRRLDALLPQFAKVNDIHVVSKINSFRTRYYTVTGRPRRALIEAHFSSIIYRTQGQCDAETLVLY